MIDIKTLDEGTSPNRFAQALDANEAARLSNEDANPCARLRQVEQRVRRAQDAAKGIAGTAQILAVSKGVTPERLRAINACGQAAFGESYLQEARTKQEALSDLAIEWHFIGPVQANKTRPIAEHFAWVHSVDRLRIAERLSQQRPAHLPPLNICIQVNIDIEASKAGVLPDDLPALAHAIKALPNLRLRGLMAIPRATHDVATQNDAFRRVRLLQEQLCRESLALDTLSMGMSDDLEAAVAQGATWLRIGTAIFGARPA
ncbi:MAG: YggS family pyridoxal phosphate-dependent enzyme [Halothiobacillaceae bacterium]